MPINQHITQKLKKIEQENKVKILFAIESGSRAWGFASKNSDYDIRFAYVHTMDWYLSIKAGRDVIEYPIEDVIDINGWDIKKALQLFYESNPTLLEWLKSPIVYLQQGDFKDDLQHLEKDFFSAIKCFYHYLRMAKNNYQSYFHGTKIPLKKYFYVLRPLLACKWIEKYHTSPPIQFEKLAEDILSKELTLRDEINLLLDRKINSEEMEDIAAIEILNTFIENEFKYYENYENQILKLKKPRADIEILHELFRKNLYAHT